MTFIRWRQTRERKTTDNVQQKTLQQRIFCGNRLEGGSGDKEGQQQQQGGGQAHCGETDSTITASCRTPTARSKPNLNITS